MKAVPTSFLAARRRPQWWVIAIVALGHLVAIYGLIRGFAPESVASVEREVLSTFNVTIAAPPPPPPAADTTPDEGAASAQGARAVPKPITAPTPDVALASSSPVPRVSSTGSESTSGARDSGFGTGAAGSGMGTGSGRGGSGQGGAVTKVSVRSGSIDESRDFPIPAGGRSVRAGTSVTVAFTVGVDGRASDCSVVRPGPDPETNALLCSLVIERIRFNPARDAQGQPVPARYGWKQDFFRR